jgi:hypothetical protein
MAEYVASPSCVKLHMQRSYVQKRGCIAWNSHFRIAQRSTCAYFLPGLLLSTFDLWLSPHFFRGDNLFHHLLGFFF